MVTLLLTFVGFGALIGFVRAVIRGRALANGAVAGALSGAALLLLGHLASAWMASAPAWAGLVLLLAIIGAFTNFLVNGLSGKPRR